MNHGEHRCRNTPPAIAEEKKSSTYWCDIYHIVSTQLHGPDALQRHSAPPGDLYANIKLLHMILAFLTDIFLLLHIYVKYLRNWGLKSYAILKSHKDRRHLNYYLP